MTTLEKKTKTHNKKRIKNKINVGEKIDTLNKLVLHHSFYKTVVEINKLKIQLPIHPTYEELDFQLYAFPLDGDLVTKVEEMKNYKLNKKKGESLAQNNAIFVAYDESVNKFSALEGTAFLTSHSLVIHYNKEYIPTNFLTFYFYTRSKTYTSHSKYIKYSLDPEVDSKRDYVTDRTKFIIDNAPKNSIMFIDGPLIGGQISDYTINLNNELLKKNIVPVFFVKNSNSNLITENIKGLVDKFNSDMHWAYNILKPGERTNFFKYVDKQNPNNAKIFCYLKSFDKSPQRIEFHISTYQKYQDIISDIINLIYYLLLVQGDLNNPQIRSIAIAEKYARDTIRLMDLTKIMKKSGIIPTMNQERFAWG